jgi:hypothetical protein
VRSANRGGCRRRDDHRLPVPARPTSLRMSRNFPHHPCMQRARHRPALRSHRCSARGVATRDLAFFFLLFPCFFRHCLKHHGSALLGPRHTRCKDDLPSCSLYLFLRSLSLLHVVVSLTYWVATCLEFRVANYRNCGPDSAA